MLVHAHDRRIDHVHRRIMSSGESLHDPVPDAGPPPANEPIVASRTGSVGFRQITPRRARPQDAEDTIEDTPVVYPGDVARFVREHRHDDAPFAVAQFIAHFPTNLVRLSSYGRWPCAGFLLVGMRAAVAAGVTVRWARFDPEGKLSRCK
jgi:hypothetical protein